MFFDWMACLWLVFRWPAVMWKISKISQSLYSSNQLVIHDEVTCLLPFDCCGKKVTILSAKGDCFLCLEYMILSKAFPHLVDF